MTADPLRRRRLRQWSRGLVAVALLSLVGALVSLQPALHWIAERELTRGLDARVRIERLRISPIASTLHVSGLSVREKRTGQPLLRVEDLEVQVVPGALWRRELVVTQLRLEKPEAWVAQTADGLSWLSMTTTASGPPALAITLQEIQLLGGRIHIADRRRNPEHREVVEDVTVSVRGLSTRGDRREARQGLTLRGSWRGMTVSADGWVAPFATRRAFHLPVRIAQADLGLVAGILPAGLAPAGLRGDAEVGLDVRGVEAGDGWQVEAAVRAEARGVTARPRPDVSVAGGSVRLQGQAHWTPRVMGFSQLRLDVSGVRMEAMGGLQASVGRLTARGKADLDHRGLLVPEMTVEATALNLGPGGRPPRVRVGRITIAGGTDQRAGTVRLERVSLADVMVQGAREPDGSIDLAGWVPLGGPPGGAVENGRPSYWEILRLEVDRAGLDFVDRANGTDRFLTVRDATLRLAGATSDPAQPVRFVFNASTSLASTVALSGTWVRTPLRLKSKSLIRDLNLPELRSWLTARLPVEVSSGRANIAARADLQSDQKSLRVSGSADLTLRDVGFVVESRGSLQAEDLEVNLRRFLAAGPGPAAMSLEAEGWLRGRRLHAFLGGAPSPSGGEVSAGEIQVTVGRMRLAPGEGATKAFTLQGQATVHSLQARAAAYGVESFAAQRVQAEVGFLTANLDSRGSRIDLQGRAALEQAEGTGLQLPVRTWKVAGLALEVGQFRTEPFRLHLRDVRVDQPEIQAVRSGAPDSPAAVAMRGGGLPPIRLDRLVVRNGRIGFRDETVQPAWAAQFAQVEGVVEDLRTDANGPASVRLSAVEAEGTRLRLDGRVHPATWSATGRAEIENLDLLRPAPYLPGLVHRVVRGGTASGALDLSLRREGRAVRLTGNGDVTFAPIELGDVERQLTLLLAEGVRARVDHFSLDPLVLELREVRLERPWFAVGRTEDGSVPVLRLLNALRRSGEESPAPAGARPSVTVQRLAVKDGIAEIEDRAVRPRFRDQVRDLDVVIEGLTTQEGRKASVTLTGELSDRAAVALEGFILPLPTNLYVDLEGRIRDLNLHRLNTYAAQVTSYRLEQGKLYSQVRYRIEQNRLEGDNLLRIDQLALGERVESEDRFEALVGVPLTLAVSLLQDSSGEILLRVPVRGDLAHPEFDLGEVIAAAVKNAVIQLVMAPFRLIGQIFTLGERIGAIEVAPVLFASGSWALDDAARAHLGNIAAVLRDRPKMKVKLSGMVHADSDEEGLRAQKVEEQLQRVAREAGVGGRDDALDRLFLRSFGASVGALTPEQKFAKLKAVQKVTPRDLEDLPDARTLSIYDYLAGVEGIERDRMFLAEGKIYRTAEGGGDWARRVEFTILQP